MKRCSPNNPELKTNVELATLCESSLGTQSDRTLGNTSYTWDIYYDFDIFKVNEYGNIVQQLTDTPGYDAEGVVSPDGSLIAFTSLRHGDLDLYIMNADGTNVRQVR